MSEQNLGFSQAINSVVVGDNSSAFVGTNNVINHFGEVFLPTARGAAFGSFAEQHEPECLPGTRTDLLDRIAKWVDDPQGKSMFWLNGMAGTGKSTISRTVAKSLKTNGHLGASFFFKRGEGDRGNGSKLFTTIASQLASRFLHVKSSIQKVINADPDISTKAFNEQFDKLILEPLSTPNGISPIPKVVVVIDALDECEPEYDVQHVLYLLAVAKEIKPVDLRVFLTSRPELPIRLGFKKLSENPYQALVLHEIPSVEHDLSLFLVHELSKIRDDHYLPLDWPGDEATQKLVKMAVPLFIFAATLCRFIGDNNWNPKERIKMVIEQRTNLRASKLDKTYLPILDQLAVGQDDSEIEELARQFRQIIGTIIILSSPLSIPSLASLLSISEENIDDRLKPLHSVLNIPKNRDDPIRTFHLSFRDFLLDPSTRKKSQFWVDEKEAHRRIAYSCINLMSSPAGIRKNICCIGSPGTLRSQVDKTLIGKHISSELQYACRYWIYHVEQSGDKIHEEGQVHRFLQEHLLHWFEAMSLLGDMAKTIKGINILNSMVDVRNEKGKILSEFIYDIKRFALQNQDIINRAHLQTYYSAIIFLPENSIVKKLYNPAKMIQGISISIFPKIQNEWNALLQTLEGDTNWVKAVAFSPNSTTLVSGAGDNTIRLWDALTGKPLLTLEGHISWVSAVAFSPDGKTLASGGDDNTVRLWDAFTGNPLQMLEGHTDRIKAVAFSPDGKNLASGADDGTVRLWNALTGKPLQMLEGHNDWVNAVAFSPDSKTLASGGNDNTIKLRDALTGKLLQMLEGHTGWVNAVAFSPDGKTLASGGDDETVRLWDAITGKSLQTLEEHTDCVNAVAFSPDGKNLASGANDMTVRLWDAFTGKPLQMLEGHTDVVNAVAFSPDGKTLASGADDRTVRLWDTLTGKHLQMLEEHTDWANAAVFSPDGKTSASGAKDWAVRLWDALTGKSLQMLERHRKTLVPGAKDDTAKSWDTLTGKPLQMLEGHNGWVTAVAFSPEGKTLASGAKDYTVRLWDALTSKPLQTLEGHNGWVTAVAFSPDSKTLASGGDDETVRLWDAITGKSLQTLEEHTGYVNAVAFSPDGKTLASGANDATVRLWEALTGKSLWTLLVAGYSDWVTAVAFSPDGKTLASGATDRTVRLWDVSTGKSLQTLEGHNDWVNAVAFSPDGKTLASRANDRTVRLWDVALTGRPLQTFVGDDVASNLSFSKDGRYIGSRYIVTGKSSSADEPDMPVQALCGKDQSAILHVQGEWLTRGDENLLWLPHNYRPTCSTVYDNRVFFGPCLWPSFIH